MKHTPVKMINGIIRYAAAALLLLLLLLPVLICYTPAAAANCGGIFIVDTPFPGENYAFTREAQWTLSPEIRELLKEKALQLHVPPALVKAIALVESGGRHYRNDGSVIVGASGEIGIMQVYPDPWLFTPEELEQLYELEFNVKAGIKILIEKKMYSGHLLPVFVEPHDRGRPAMYDHILETWYFALWAYNGWLERNHPLLYEGDTYQEKILDALNSLGYTMETPPAQLFTSELPAPGTTFPLPGRTSCGYTTPDPHGVWGLVKAGNLNVRSLPGTSFGPDREQVPIKGQLAQGEVVFVRGVPSTLERGRWYELEATCSVPKDESPGWVAQQYKVGSGLQTATYVELFPRRSTPFTGKELPLRENTDPHKPDWTIRFNFPLDPHTITGEHIYLTDFAGSTIPTRVAPGADTATVILYPLHPYCPGEKYYLYIEEGVRSQGQQTLQEGVRLPFIVRT